MSVNSSSFADSTLPPYSNSSFHPLMKTCFSSRSSIYFFSVFSVIYILLLLPVLILVLYLGYQKWRKQRSISTATSHSDHFTYHSVFMQLNESVGLILCFIGGYINLLDTLSVGIGILSVNSMGLALFHLLTCVERYLAVVHPITYRGLRQAGGVRIRNMSIGCVWLLSIGYLPLHFQTSYEVNEIMIFCKLVFFLIVVCFCSITVLCTLKRPGPGEVGGNRERVDRSKQRAFHTIMAIMVVLLFRFAGNLIVFMITSSKPNRSYLCVVMISTTWFGLPSSLVLPLLFLHRAGKLQCCKQNTESG